MGLTSRLLTLLFGEGRNVVVETLGALRENPEAGAERETERLDAALSQFAAEFGRERRGFFDRLVDGLNRLPRPLMAFGTLGLFVAAMAAPDWFARRMQGVALVPEPLWWLMGAVVSFYFGARHQAKGQEFQRSVAATMLRSGQVTRALRAQAERAADAGGENAALAEWRAGHG